LCSKANGKERPKAYALKVQVKYELANEGQLKAVIEERNILRDMNHPFISKLVMADQDEHFIYMLMDFIQGGELFSVIHEELDTPGLPEDQVRFYSLCLADALAYMHRSKIVYRDLKPENVMIDSTGYPMLIDFGFAKVVHDKTYTLCGTPGYLPPEVVMTRGHDISADHWSYGILVYEMLTGENPFYYSGMDQMTLFRCIVQDDYEPIERDDVSYQAQDIIDKLLEKDPRQRLGSLARGEQDILEHKWFRGMKLDSMRKRKEKAPWIPDIQDPLDSSMFEDWSHIEDKTDRTYPPLSLDDELLLKNW
jgi:serine/threonine protein kinase